MVWCEDGPDLFAAMEKGRMYIFRCAFVDKSTWHTYCDYAVGDQAVV